MLVDSHCHLNRLEGFLEHRSVPHIQEAHAQGVERILCVGVNLEEMPDILALAEQHPAVHASVGIHPLDISGQEDWAAYERYAMHPKICALGEMGLDFYRGDDPQIRSTQVAVFARQIQMARQLKKPVIIHTRSAALETLEVLKTEQASAVGGVFHCFTENWSIAEQALDLGFYISISGIVTFKNATAIQDVASRVPMDRLLIETDAPYLAPQPHRGQSNVPAFVRFVAQKIADLRQLAWEDVAQQTTQNYERLFLQGSVYPS